ncbi:hypothetical protein BDV96DRAFT_96345 [Lophiotrema nucula]|uniref:Uncharacterized protein n=1 Tax=Lophiotrema nucula TaxID=690887 RepID=A0A6A5Z4Z0_9PLEO|nr:hypothetical protein BDV96DRAFT_96345 [Lophiotrema nucula]
MSARRCSISQQDRIAEAADRPQPYQRDQAGHVAKMGRALAGCAALGSTSHRAWQLARWLAGSHSEVGLAFAGVFCCTSLLFHRNTSSWSIGRLWGAVEGRVVRGIALAAFFQAGRPDKAQPEQQSAMASSMEKPEMQHRGLAVARELEQRTARTMHQRGNAIQWMCALSCTWPCRCGPLSSVALSNLGVIHHDALATSKQPLPAASAASCQCNVRSSRRGAKICVAVLPPPGQHILALASVIPPCCSP